MQEDSNYQEMSVFDKDNAALGPTEEAQDMRSLNRVTVPMPAFVNPHQPLMASGSINLSIDETPVPHSDDFGAETGDHVQTSVMDAEASTLEVPEPVDGSDDAPAEEIEFPDDRAQWTKVHWQAAARADGLHVSGTIDEVKDRVEEFEGAVEDAKSFRATDWVSAIEDAETADDLKDVQKLYDRSGASFSTVADAFSKRTADLNS